MSVVLLSEFLDRIMVQSPFPLPSVSALILRTHIRLGYSLVNMEGENGQVPQYYISFEQSPGRGVWRICQERRCCADFSRQMSGKRNFST